MLKCPGLTIRVDAGPGIGAGHVVRMIALGQAWLERGGVVTFVSDFQGLDFGKTLREYGYAVRLPEVDDAGVESLSSLIMQCKGGWLVVDGYHFDSDYMLHLHEAGVRTLVLDDVNDRACYYGRLLLNQNMGSQHIGYRLSSGMRLLLGEKYTLLRKEFRERRQSKTIEGTAQKILLTLGGAPSVELVERCLRALESACEANCHVRIMCGWSDQRKVVQQLVKSVGMNVELVTASNSIASEMLWADLAISTAGSTAWELCCLGVPMVLLTVADNQKWVGRELASAGVAINLPGNVGAELFSSELNRLIFSSDARKRMSRCGQSLIDGKGAGRVADAMLMDSTQLRPATMQDAVFLFELRNSPSVRSASINSEPVLWDRHLVWLKEQIGKEDSLLWILEDSVGTQLGQIRVDWCEGEGTVSLSVVPDVQGKGIGTELLRKGLEVISRLWPEGVLVALILPRNRRSRSVFETNGFSLEGAVILDKQEYLRFRREVI